MIAAMLSLLFWCPVLAAVQTLTIDSQLGTSIEDCFDRISIGEQLSPDAIYRNITELTTHECETLCKQDKQCQTFDYGVGAKGNATCNLSTLGDSDLRAQNQIQRHPDYDVYVRRVLCEQMAPSPLQPQFDEENPPLHRPIFRPDEEEPKNPLSDDFADLRPFETRPNFGPPRPNYIDLDRPDDYNSKPSLDNPPSYGAHRPPEIPYRPIRPLRPYPEPIRPDLYMPERPWVRPGDPYRPQRPRPDVPYGPEKPLKPEDYRPIRPNDPYGSDLRPDDPYKPDRPLRPDPYRPERPGSYRPDEPYRPSYNRPYNHSRPKPDPYDELQFQGGYGRPKPDPGLWRPDPIYPPSPNDDVPDLYGPKPVRPERPPYKPEDPEYHYIVRPNKKPRPQHEYNKPAEDPYKPNKPDYESNRPDPYSPIKPDPIEDSGYGNKPIQDYPTKPNDGYKPKPDPYGPGPIGPPDRPYRPNRPYYDYPSRPSEKPSYSYNSQYASGYGQSQENSIHLEIYDPPRPYKPMRPLNDKPYPSQGYGQNYGYGSYSGHHSYAPPSNSHLGYGPIESGYGQNYNRPGDEKPDRPYGQGSYGSQNFDHSSGYGHKPQNSKPSYSNQGFYGQNNFAGDHGGSSYGGHRPSYGQDDKPYGVNDRPSYTSPKPSYGISHDSPSYGSTQRPPYGDTQGKPSYGAQTPSYGNQDPNRPDANDKPYGSNQNGQSDYKPSQKPNETYRPDVRPVYEYELEKPGNVPSYIVKPNGDVITSRPVSVGDYGKPGYGDPSYGDKPGYGKPGYVYGEKPGYGEKPQYSGYGDKPAYDRPSYGSSNSYGSKPGYGDKPGYERPEYGDKPAYDRPMYGTGDGNRPGYGPKPGYGDKPEYDKPEYGVKPEYGGGDDNRPGYGSKPGYGEKPGYDTEYGDKPGYGGGDGNRPGYGDAGYRDPGKLGSYKAECQALKALRDNENLLVLRADKGNATVVMDSSEYDGKMKALLADRKIYKPVKYNPTARVTRRLRNLIKDHEDLFEEDEYNRLYRPKSVQPPKLYGLPKASSHHHPRHLQSVIASLVNRAHDLCDPEHLDGELAHVQAVLERNGYRGRMKRKPKRTERHPEVNRQPAFLPYVKGITDKIGAVLKKFSIKTVYKPLFKVADLLRSPKDVIPYQNPGVYKIDCSCGTCFRRVLAGRRAVRSHVRRVVHCERLEDCRRECGEERRFHCESFNYRLDPSFRGKGLCELMTKPIEAFDLRRDFVDDKDYDFYEIDRNSLEPNCPESLRGPGLLHSGYLSSKPSQPAAASWAPSWDRLDFHGSSHQDRFYDDRQPGRPGPGRVDPGHRRYEDQFYIPYQIGVGRSNDDQAWGQYGGVYGGDTYYKNRNDYHKSINYWRLSTDSDLEQGVRPWGFKTDFNYNDLRRDGDDEIHPYSYGSWKRGRWNNSGTGNGLDYGESNYYKPSYGPPKKGPECTSERRPGLSLSTGSIRRSLLAHNVLECEAACFEERDFKCVSYSYRYSNSHGSDNCFLSERPYRGLDLATDSGSDVYAMPQDCAVSVSHRPWVESECFWHVRSGVAVSETIARAAITVTGLGACEAECIRAQGFFCRVFSFRFSAPTIGEDLPNCILTTSPPTSLSAGRGLRPSKGHELYARGNYGRGCEPALFDYTAVSEPKKECYLQYDNAAKLIGSAIKGHARVRDEQSCGIACTDAPFRCLSFSFNNIAPPGVDNCLLSEIRLFDLQKGVDYEHSTDDWLFAFDLFNGQCWRKVHGKDFDDHPGELPRPLLPPVQTYPVDRPDASGPSYLPAPEVPPYISGPPSGPPSGRPSGPSGPPSGPSGPTGPYPEKPYIDPGFKPSYPYPDPRPEYPNYKPFEPYLPSSPGSGYPGSGYEKPGYQPIDRPGYRPEGRPVRPIERPYPGEKEEGPIAVSWSKYTVSGFPCRAGTTCAQNHVAGHWACEPEGGEVGSWDYCCAPSHRCGYSEGFSKPWCYVGPENDQWRPCSEKYYPYHQHNVPHPSQGHREPPSRLPGRPWSGRPGHFADDRDKPMLGPYISEEDRKYWDDLYKDGPKAYYDQYGNPLPGYTRVPAISRPHIKYHHNYPRPGTHWAPLAPEAPQELDPPVPGGLGVPRYWPVAYLHKGPPPNITYFKFNESTPTTEKHGFYPERPERPRPDRPNRPNEIDRNDRPEPPRTKPGEFVKINTDKPNNDIDIKSHRDEKTRNIVNITDNVQEQIEKAETTTPKIEIKSKEEPEEKAVKEAKVNSSDVEIVKPVIVSKDNDKLKGIDDKLEDLTESIEVLDIEDAKKGEKESDLKTLEAEEKQIEAIGRLLASRRRGQLIIEKRSQKDLESKNIAVDKDLVDFNFGNRFPTTERRGIIQKVTKEEIEREKNNDRSLEVSETTFVRPPRVLSTTENIRKAIVNGKVFYDATIREQRDIFNNATRKPRNFRHLEENRAPSVFSSNNYGKKKTIKARNVNPVRRVRRVYRKRYNPEEVRKRLLEREKSLKEAKEVKA
ncbi:uncharacterized protein LOC134676779 [Cydia fagiglandana]|uniref:uncharacterized protein LOC134676779 n=1 Tax=Cydia fagiglandana TaxID=1458189 RepID=UPI002FEE0D4A